SALRVDRPLTDRQDLTAGLEVARDSIDRNIVRLDDSPDARTSGGVFLQHQWHLGSERRVHLISGVREDAAEGFGAALSPRMALVAEPTGDLMLRASWSRAWR